MKFYAIFLVLFLLFFSTFSLAQQTGTRAESEAKIEQRARVVGRSLRCVVCQNQSIDDSNAPLAADMRIMVRERIRVGDTNAQTIEYMRERYGDFVLLKPPFQANTILLWAAPLGLMIMLLIWYGVRSRRPRTAQTAIPLTQNEQEKFEKLTEKTRPKP